MRIKKNLEGVVRHQKSGPMRRPLLRLDLNEGLGGFPAENLKEALSAVDEGFLSAYPDYSGLYRRLATKHDVGEDGILLTNGSDAASKLIFDTFVSDGDSVLVTSPTFAMHRVYAQIAGASIEEIPYPSETQAPAQQVLGRIVHGTRLVVLINPVNPFGTLYAEADLRAIIAKAAGVDALCFVDEAYIEFGGQSAIPWVREFKNLIVTRTFSKAYGLAGLRLGYAISSPDTVKALRLTQPTYDVNQMAVLFGEYLLDHPELLEATLRQVAAGREALKAEAIKLGLAHHCGTGNFMLIDLGPRRGRVMERLRRDGILVSTGFGSARWENSIRVTLGPPDKMSRFAAALRAALAEVH